MHRSTLLCAMSILVFFLGVRVQLTFYYCYAGPVCFMPVPPPGAIRGPHPPRFVPYQINVGAPVVGPETLALKANIVKQIEYYFRQVLYFF